MQLPGPPPVHSFQKRCGMSAFRRMFALVLVCLATFCAGQLSDQLAAARVLGPHWRQMSRISGMVFSGTVLSVEASPAGKDRPLPLWVTKFRVDRAIAGGPAGEVLTVREWTGAWANHRAMNKGERLLIFLYPQSRLGLTSPVGGRLGQVKLDSRGEIVAGFSRPAISAFLPDPDSERPIDFRSPRLPLPRRPVAQPRVTVLQLERAIRSARNSPPPGILPQVRPHVLPQEPRSAHSRSRHAQSE